MDLNAIRSLFRHHRSEAQGAEVQNPGTDALSCPIQEIETMSMAATTNLEIAPPRPLSMRLAVSAGCVALADWLFYGWPIGLSLALFFAVLGVTAVASNGVHAPCKVQIVMTAVFVAGLIALVEDADILSAMRVFTAMPVIVRDQVAGVVYASRTPSNVFKNLYEQRAKLALAMLSTIVPTLLIGFLFHRTITEPMRELIDRTHLIGKGDSDALRPLKRPGTREFALLSHSFLEMARRLDTRSSFISTFATHVSHELKSPLTSIQGAAELLRDDIDAAKPDMTDSDRRKFLDNIIADTNRLTKISVRLRDFARAENPVAVGTTTLSVPIAHLRSAFASLDIRSDGELDTRLQISEENADIILSNLADNAKRHGSSRLAISAHRQDDRLRVEVIDNGEGISPNNRSQIFDSFFTTRRDSGGTGMGLAIVRAMLEAHGGAIRLLDASQGTAFELMIPIAQDAPGG
jgi:signal transduction histidine kinase